MIQNKIISTMFLVIVLALLSSCSGTKEETTPLSYGQTIQVAAKTATTKVASTKIAAAKVAAAKVASNQLDTKEYNWYFKFMGKGVQPTGPDDNSYYKELPSCVYIGKPDQKCVYLTFDQGYENGYTTKILDILKENDVKAAFFCVKPYLSANKELVRRMVDEGHIVCNHSSHHPSMAAIKDLTKFKAELTDVEDEYTQITGKQMPKLFRPPMGKYSELSLKNTEELGYKTVFWSLAYMDWMVDKQPTEEYAKSKLFNKMHNGAIILLHSVSKTNTSILDGVIKELKQQGYKFESIDKL